ncbi:MAG TPA: porin family protein [Vicinamibacterales bacterium]|nr:porin family protein [Vicinamibacterales bacterium]
MRFATSIVAAGLFAVLGFATPARAQELKAGFSMATIRFSPESGSPELSSTEQLTGFVGGVSFFLTRSRLGGWQIEALLHQKGARNLLRIDDRLRLTYLEVPVLLHGDFYQLGPRALFFVAGPAFAFNTHASYTDEGEKEDVKDDIEDFDIGLVVGGGVELRRLTVEARYTWGLRRAFQDGDLEGSFKNRAFSVTVGYRFGR